MCYFFPFSPGRGKGKRDILRNRSPPFQINRRPSHRNQRPDHPHNQREANAPRQLEDGTRGREDAGPDHAVEDEERGADDADLAAVFGGGVEDISFILNGLLASPVYSRARSVMQKGKMNRTQLGNTVRPSRGAVIEGLRVGDEALLVGGFGDRVGHFLFLFVFLSSV